MVSGCSDKTLFYIAKGVTVPGCNPERSLLALQSQKPAQLLHLLYLLSLEAVITSSTDLRAGKEQLLGFNPV